MRRLLMPTPVNLPLSNAPQTVVVSVGVGAVGTTMASQATFDNVVVRLGP